MSTFFVLPSQALLGQRFAEFLEGVFPGVPWQRNAWRELAESLGAELRRRSDGYVVYREELTDGKSLADSLMTEFGAEPGDEVVEVALGGRLAALMTKRWRIGDQRHQAA